MRRASCSSSTRWASECPGRWVAAEGLDVWPDLLCCGKGLSAGYYRFGRPRVTARRRRLLGRRGEDNLQFQSGDNFAGNPVSAAGARRDRLLQAPRRARQRPGPWSSAHGRRPCRCSSLEGGARAVDKFSSCLHFRARHRGRLARLSAGGPGSAGLLVRASPRTTDLVPPLIVTSTRSRHASRRRWRRWRPTWRQRPVEAEVAFGI